jgi:hypothetical protein
MRPMLLVSLLMMIVNEANSQSTWTAPVSIAHTSAEDIHPTIANGQGWVYQGEELLAFSRNGKDICVLRTAGNGASWSDSAKHITTDSADNDYPSLFHMGSGQSEIAMLVWQSRKNGNLDIYASKYSQLAWSSPQRITTSIEDDRFPHVTWISDRYFVVWEQQGRVMFSEYDGLAWSTPEFTTPEGDTLNMRPQVTSVWISSAYQPLVIWERRKNSDTTSSLMYSYRNGTIWTAPDTLAHAGDNRQPRFFKYHYSYFVQWEKVVGSFSQCYAGACFMTGGKFRLQSISTLTFSPDDQHNTAVNGYAIITDSPNQVWHAISAWESPLSCTDSIGVCIGYYMTANRRLGAPAALYNRNPDVSQGTRVGTSGFLMRFWVVWEANVANKWQLYGSYTTILIDDVEEANRQPNTFHLEQNYPNPFNPSTTIGYRISEQGFVSIRVFDVLGREVATLVNEEKHAGTHQVVWDASQNGLASGVYFYKFTIGGFVQTRKLLLLK